MKGSREKYVVLSTFCFFLAALHGKYITKKHQYKGVNEECYTFFQL
jgi:hypothetical protein